MIYILFRNRIIRSVLSIAVMILFQGCSTFSPNNKDLPIQQTNHSFSNQESPPLGPPGKFNLATGQLAQQLVSNRDNYNISDNPIAVTSFVDIENYKVSNKIGELIADNLIHEMQVHGFRVVDHKIMPAIQVTGEGDFIRSRAVHELRNKHNINIVLSGTYTNHGHGVTVNARMVDLMSGVVLSTAQTYFPRDVVTPMLDYYYPIGKVKRQNDHAPPRKRRRGCFPDGVCIR